MNNNKKNIILIGGGGHCKSCIEVIESTGLYHIIGILDLPQELGKKVLNYEVIGNDADIEKFHQLGFSYVITAGQIKSAALRKRIFADLVSIDADIETVISPTATVSKYSSVGKGSMIMHHTVINADAILGENCIVNSASVIEHDVILGDHVHISTNVIVNGNCKIGSESFVGSACCISNGVEIGNQIVIGAGSLVINDIKEKGTYVGAPVRKVK